MDDGEGGGWGSECLRWRSGSSLCTYPLPSGKMSVVVNVVIFRLPAMYWRQALKPIKIPHLHDAVIDHSLLSTSDS